MARSGHSHCIDGAYGNNRTHDQGLGRSQRRHWTKGLLHSCMCATGTSQPLRPLFVPYRLLKLSNTLPQTAGTGSLADRPITRAVTEDRVFSDKSDNMYEYLKKRQEQEDLPLRRSDVTIVELGRALNVPTFILMSPLIYGTGTGYFNQRSIQIPNMVRAAVKAKHAEMVADGAGRWGNIHIEDLASLYEVLIARILRGDDPVASGEKGIYFTVSGEHAWRDIVNGIAREGHALGTFEDAEVKPISLEEAGKKWMGGSAGFAELVFCSKSVVTLPLIQADPSHSGTNLCLIVLVLSRISLGNTAGCPSMIATMCRVPLWKRSNVLWHHKFPLQWCTRRLENGLQGFPVLYPLFFRSIVPPASSVVLSQKLE